MAGTVSEQDLRRVLDVVDAAQNGPAVTPDGVPDALLQALAALVPSDVVTFYDPDPATATSYVCQDWDGDRTTLVRNDVPEPHDAFWRHYADTPCCSYPTTSGDTRTVTMRGDFYTALQWRQTAMYADVFRADGFEDEVMCCLPGTGTRSPRLLFFRTTSSFAERDRLVLTLLRPHLVELHRRARGALTQRQTELLRMVAAGSSNAEIAATLFVSPHTVRKHLENIFARLEVTSRTAAVARAFPS
jgi:DNA-binding CsgD family transcriptional regulator